MPEVVGSGGLRGGQPSSCGDRRRHPDRDPVVPAAAGTAVHSHAFRHVLHAGTATTMYTNTISPSTRDTRKYYILTIIATVIASALFFILLLIMRLN
ncbi:hypothetical protein QE152_g27116 [Popillia japonica]|uniref:Uncharacterized protein n=1 Tax=Popillia japonica TaxID=7064 RepID=A0AAW1JX90_POPJA